MKKVLNLTETAEYLGFSKRNFYRMIEDGRFDVPPIKGSHPKKWAFEHVEAWRLAQ